MDYVSFGQIITDDVYFPGIVEYKNVLGGSAYVAAGLRIWSENVGVCSGIGKDFGKMHGEWFSCNKIDTSGTIVKAKRSAHSKINYFENGEREEISLPGCGSLRLMMPDPSEIPLGYRSCKGLYFFKDCDRAFWDAMGEYLEKYPTIAAWEILGASACPQNYDTIRKFLKKVTIFSLNLTEGRQLCQKDEPLEIVREILKMGAKTLLFRMSEKGALVANQNGIWHIPAIETKVVDVTGGGNSSTGGFLAGYCESGGDIVTAGKYACVSASFIIEQYGPPKLIDESLMQKARERTQTLKEIRLD